MKLKDLVGKHKLSGVDYMPSLRNKEKYDDYGNDILFCLDGVTYLMTENEDDGYRSYMTDLEITDRKIKNMFPKQDVECKYVDKSKEWNEESDILQLYSLGGKLILEIGTGNTDDYYPYTVFNFSPESMDINKE